MKIVHHVPAQVFTMSPVRTVEAHNVIDVRHGLDVVGIVALLDIRLEL